MRNVLPTCKVAFSLMPFKRQIAATDVWLRIAMMLKQSP